jgi:hypothetical protein
MLAKQCLAGAGGEPLALSGFLTMPTSGQRGSGRKVHCMALLHALYLWAYLAHNSGDTPLLVKIIKI